MNTVVMQSSWVGLVGKEPEIEGLIVRKNHSFIGQYLIGGRVEIHQLSQTLKAIERDFKGTLLNAVCRFTTTKGEAPTNILKSLGFVKKEDSYEFRKNDFVIRLSQIDDDLFSIWKVELDMSMGFMISASAGHILTRVISLLKYELDIKTQHGLQAVI
ncbi:hypothetical protein [Bacillus sp. FJAT-29937]|uniref:hypothetical protein n=1 Tax=Bacillus sp. FJAT-29937 TaxID=1720553 RepID=UPI0008374A7D|nr:hypothetical protein [Bacillus sp. FJAT-29937]